MSKSRVRTAEWPCILSVSSPTAGSGTFLAAGGEPTVRAAMDDVDLPSNHMIPARTYTIAAGASMEYGNVTVSCPSGGRACDLTVASATSAAGTFPKTGGTPTVTVAMDDVDLPSNHMIPARTYTIAAGASMEYGNVEVACPAGGEACVLTVASDDAAAGTYERTGGMPTFVSATEVVTLPENHQISSDTYELDAGESARFGNAMVSCPDNGPACVLTVAMSDAEAGTYEKTGGKPTIMPATMEIDLPNGHTIPATKHTIAAGENRKVGNVVVSCPTNVVNCVLNVETQGAEKGTYYVTGGMPSFNVAGEFDLPANHGIRAGTFTIKAGATENRGNVNIQCPATDSDGNAGNDCEVTIMDSSTNAKYATKGKYRTTGGLPTATPVLVNSQLPGHHGIPEGADVTIPAGREHHGRHGVSLKCPAGGRDCVVNITASGGVYHKTGGVPEVLVHQLVRAAYDEPDRAASVFDRTFENSLGDKVQRIRSNSAPPTFDATATYNAGSVEFELMAPPGSLTEVQPELFHDLRTPDRRVDSNIPDLISGSGTWTGAALSRLDSNSGLTLHANVYPIVA